MIPVRLNQSGYRLLESWKSQRGVSLQAPQGAKPWGPAIVCGKPARKTLVAENDRDNGDVIFLPETTSGVGNFGGG